jgi:hypothetical protein
MHSGSRRKTFLLSDSFESVRSSESSPSISAPKHADRSKLIAPQRLGFDLNSSSGVRLHGEPERDDEYVMMIGH